MARRLQRGLVGSAGPRCSPLMKLATVQIPSFWILKSPFFSRDTKGGSTLQAISCWMCRWGPAATLLRAQAASFWIAGLGCLRSRGSTLRMPASMATCVWRSVPVTTFPTVRREGVWKNKARSVTTYCRFITVKGDNHTTICALPSMSHAMLMALWKPVNNG